MRAGVVSVARISAMSLRDERQLHKRNAALGTNRTPISTSHATISQSLLRPAAAFAR
jgi:hypothetical protein